MTEQTHENRISDRGIETVNEFVFGGKAIFTLRSRKTGTRFTYKVEPNDAGTCHFVGVLTDSDNNGRYSYLGLFRGPDYAHDRKERISRDAPSARAFSFFAGCLRKGRIHEDLEVYHEGRCGRCNRLLTVPESVLTGIGPECARKLGIEQVRPEKPRCEKVDPIAAVLAEGTDPFAPFETNTGEVGEAVERRRRRNEIRVALEAEDRPIPLAAARKSARAAISRRLGNGR